MQRKHVQPSACYLPAADNPRTAAALRPVHQINKCQQDSNCLLTAIVSSLQIYIIYSYIIYYTNETTWNKTARAKTLRMKPTRGARGTFRLRSIRASDQQDSSCPDEPTNRIRHKRCDVITSFQATEACKQLYANPTLI